MSNEAQSAVRDRDGKSVVEDLRGNAENMQPYSVWAAPDGCQLSTCAYLLKEMGVMQEKMRSAEEKMRKMEQDMKIMAGKMKTSEEKMKTMEDNITTMDGKVKTSKEMMKNMEEQLRTTEEYLSIVEGKMKTMESSMKAMESELKAQKQLIDENAEDWTEHVNKIQNCSSQTAMKQKMKTMEEEMKILKDRLQASEDQVPELATVKTKVAAIERELQISQNEIVQLKGKDGAKIAFSAFLGGHGNVGPYGTNETLQYKYVITNIGNAYKPATGRFIAPVKGVYYFYFCYHAGEERNTKIVLYKNNQHIATASHFGHEERTLNKNGSNGVTLVLQPQDQVYVALIAGCWVWDGHNHDTVFTGLLIKQL